MDNEWRYQQRCGDINKDKVRVLFENDEIGVEHSFVTFNDGNKEAVIGCL